MRKQVKTHTYYIIIAVVGLLCFFGLSFIDTLYRSKEDAGVIIAQDIALLKDVFQKIHKDCGIIDFDAQKNPINFLNVVKFTGSEVGPMNLMHPEKWQGPYLKDNPTIYHIAYQVVSTRKGYFITPGDGVVLPNKKVVGKDIVLDKNADIEKMMIDPQLLSYKEKSLAAYLPLGSSMNMRFFFDDDQDND